MNTTTNNSLVLQVEWTGEDGEFGALWHVGSSQPSGEVTLLASGAAWATKDRFLANLDANLAAECYKRGNIIVGDGDFDTFEVSIIG